MKNSELKSINAASIENYEIVEVTAGINGYPCNLQEAIIGFADFTEAEDFAERHDLTVVSLEKRDGHDFWTSNGSICSAYSMSAEDYGDDYQDYSNRDVDEYVRARKDCLRDMLDDMTCEQLRKFAEETEETADIITAAADDELVILCCGEFFKRIKKQYMRYHDGDVTEYSIGVI